MDRRRLLAAIFGTGAGALAPGAAAHAAARDGVPSAVYHLSDIGKTAFVLGNMHNHIDGVGGPDKVTLALVVHGPPLLGFRADLQDRTTATSVAALQAVGVSFFACVNTMKGMNLALQDLVPGFAVAEKGGVVKLAELQRLGWAYLRP